MRRTSAGAHKQKTYPPSSEADPVIPSLRYRRLTQVGIDGIRKAVALEWKVSEQSLARRRGGEDKKAAVYLAQHMTRLGGREVGTAFGVKPARVSHIVGSIESNPSSPIARRIAKLRKRFNT